MCSYAVFLGCLLEGMVSPSTVNIEDKEERLFLLAHHGMLLRQGGRSTTLPPFRQRVGKGPSIDMRQIVATL